MPAPRQHVKPLRARPLKIPSEKEGQIRALLETTSMLPAEIAKIAGVSPPTVARIDHKFSSREPSFTYEIIHTHEIKSKAEKAENQRRANTIVHMSPELKKKIVAENIGLFINSVKAFVKRRPDALSRHRIQFGDLLHEFVIHCMDRLELYNEANSSFSHFIYELFPNFATNYFRSVERERSTEEKVVAGKAVPHIKAAQKFPRGYGLIPQNMRNIWLALGLKLETAIRFGAGETHSTLSYLARNTGLFGTEERVITMMLEGMAEKQIPASLGITYAGVNAAKLAAIKKIKKYIEEQRANGNRKA